MNAAVLPDPPAFRFGLITRQDLVRYAGAAGDFNPLHYDDAFARSAGLPGVMAHGMFSAGLLGSFLVAWVEDRRVRRFRLRSSLRCGRATCYRRPGRWFAPTRWMEAGWRNC